MTHGKYILGAERDALGPSPDNRRRRMPTHESFDPGYVLSGGNETAGPIAAHLRALDSHLATADGPLGAHLRTLDLHLATLADLLGALPPDTPVRLHANGAEFGELPAAANDQARP
jgi:hypothetical protein